MIHCPYCGSQMPDEAKFCPHCMSLLVSEVQKYQPKPLPLWLHPVTAFIILALVSTGLFAAGIIGKSGPEPEEKKVILAAKEKKRADPAPGKPSSGKARDKSRKGRRNQDRIQNSSNEDKYSEVVKYLASVNEILEKTDALGVEIDKLRLSNDKKNIPGVGEKLRRLQTLTRKITNLKSPKSLQRTHTRLASSFRVRQRGYKSLMVYMQQGDLKRLDRGRKDLETAEKTKNQSLEQIKDMVEKLTPPPPEKIPDVMEEEKPSPAETEAPPETDKKEQPPAGPGEVEGEVDTEAGGTEDAQDLLPEEGETALEEDGETIYPEDAETIYPEDEDEPYPEERDEDYPDEEDPLPADTSY